MNRSVHAALTLLLLTIGSATVAHSASDWAPIGPAPIQGTEFPGGVTGRATAIAVNPENGDQVWLGGAAGGVWFSSNRGLDWYPVSDHEESLAIGAIAPADCDSSGCDTLYVGTGENAIRRDTYYGAGLLIGSSEGGDPPSYDWTMVHGDPKTVEFRGASIHDVLFNPNTSGDSRILFVTLSSGVTVSSTNATVTAPEPALGGYGIYRSNDNGTTWTKLNVAHSDGARPTDLKMDPLNSSVMYAGFLGRGVFKSTNAGSTWCPMNAGIDGGLTCPASTGLPDIATNFDQVDIATYAQDSEVLYARFGYCDEPLIEYCTPAYFKSTDGGSTWIQRWGGGDHGAYSICPTAFSRYTHGLVVDPNNENITFAAGIGICRSSFSAGSWNRTDQNIDGGGGVHIHYDQHEFAFDPDDSQRLYVTNDGGVAYSKDGGFKWDQRNHDLQITGFHAIATTPASTAVLGTSQDNGGQFWTGGGAWSYTPCCGDGGDALLDLDDASIAYVTQNYGSFYKRINQGWSYTGPAEPSECGFDDCLGASAFYAPIIQGVTNMHPLYYGRQRLWRSTNKAVTWEAISPILSEEPALEITPKVDVITAIASGRSDPPRLYVGYYGGDIYFAADPQESCSIGPVPPPCWTKATTTLPDGPVTELMVHQSDPLTAWALFSGFGPDPRVWKTTDGGANWLPSATGLPAGVPVNAIAPGFFGPDDLVVGLDSNPTRATIWRSIDGGASWGAYSTDLPNVPIHDIETDRTRQRMFAGTHGRGAWIRGAPMLISVEDWVELTIWDIPLWGWIFPPDEVCTIEILQADGTACTSSTTDAMDGALVTDAQGRLLTSFSTSMDGVFDVKPMAWACFGGSCAGGVPTDECDTPENPIDAVRVSCGEESTLVTLQGPQMMSDPPSAGLGLDFATNGTGGAATAGAATSLDVVLTLFAANGSTASLCSVKVAPDADLPGDQTWEQAVEAINADATCMDAGVVAVNDAGEEPIGPDGGPTEVFEDDFRPPPRLRLHTPIGFGTQLIPSVHVAPGEAPDVCLELADLGLPLLSQGAVTALRFETPEAGTLGGEIYLLEQTPLGDCGITVPTEPGMTADEVALTVQSAFQQPGVPGPHADCPSKYNPRDVTANGAMITTAVASRIRICLRDDGVGVFVGPEDVGNSHPIATCVSQVVECEDASGSTVLLDGLASNDPDSTPGTDDDIVSYAWFEDDGSGDLVLLGGGATLSTSLALGSHDIRLAVTDSQGLQDQVSCGVDVVDTTAPSIGASLAPMTLWPPDHRLVDLNASFSAFDTCSASTVELQVVSSDEPDDAPGPGDGATLGDIRNAALGTEDVAFQLRAERDRNGVGRRYRVIYAASDASANTATAEFDVLVPLDMAGVVEPIIVLLDRDASVADATASWAPVDHASGYEVIGGALENLVETEDAYELGDVTCVATTNEPAANWPGAPSPGQVLFVLVQSINDLRSGFGTESALKPRLPSSGGCP